MESLCRNLMPSVHVYCTRALENPRCFIYFIYNPQGAFTLNVKFNLHLPEHFVLWNLFQTSCTHGKITFVWSEKNHKSISCIFHMKRSEMMENLPKVRLRSKDLTSSSFRKQLKILWYEYHMNFTTGYPKVSC
jgi:hypothetical protein